MNKRTVRCGDHFSGAVGEIVFYQPTEYLGVTEGCRTDVLFTGKPIGAQVPLTVVEKKHRAGDGHLCYSYDTLTVKNGDGVVVSGVEAKHFVMETSEPEPFNPLH